MTLAGTRVAQHYTLVRPLGRGASSVVYLALDDAGKLYTVKLFHEGLDENARREASMLLHNPHLGEVMATTTVNGHAAVIGRLVLGKPLFQRYQQRPALFQAPTDYLQTLLDVLSALEALHDSGTLHRDVKPDNILVSEQGHAVLVDYDLSGPILEEFKIPRRIGTQAFQSPEAVRSEPQDTQSDLWSVGILLYWGLYAEIPDPQTPTEPDHAEEEEEDTHEPFGPLPEREHLRLLARKLLEPDSLKRPRSAAQVRQELLEAARADGILLSEVSV